MVILRCQLPQACTARASVFLVLHRRFFARAIEENSSEPLESKHGDSVLSGYRICCSLSLGLRSLFVKHPQPTDKMFYFFSALFSSCVSIPLSPSIVRPFLILVAGTSRMAGFKLPIELTCEVCALDSRCGHKSSKEL